MLLLHKFLLCKLKKCVSKTRKRFNFSCDLRKNQLQKGVLHLQIARATCNNFFARQAAEKGAVGCNST